MRRNGRQAGAIPDVVLEAPALDLVSDDSLKAAAKEAGGLRPNRVRPARYRTELEEASDLYQGFDWLLVRTALIRAAGFDAKARAPALTSGNEIARLCRHLIYADQEHMVCIAVNSALDVLAIHEVAIGEASGVGSSPRQLVKVAFMVGATRMAVVHNHPSGRSSPSAQDVIFTKAARDNLACAGIPLLDHVIVARNGWTSATTASSIDSWPDQRPVRWEDT